MKVLVFGAGAIGTIYGYFLSEEGNDITHYVRENRAKQLKNGVQVDIMDGRDAKNIKQVKDIYKIKTITSFTIGEEYDLILVSIKHGSLDNVIELLNEGQVSGDILFFNGLWKNFEDIDKLISRERYLWGYPVAGGNLNYETAKLEAAILDNIIIGEPDGKETERLRNIVKLFAKANIKSEIQKNVLHWIWIHMAINAGVISTCLKYGSAAGFMDSAKALREGIYTMREGLKITEARGVNLKDYNDEIKMYYLPALFSSILFKQYFKKNILSRKIMELHNNMDDLYELCNDVYESAKKYGINTPLLTKKEPYFLNK